jgi:hypothetical protein
MRAELMADKQIDFDFELHPEDTDVAITHGGRSGKDRQLLGGQEVFSRLSAPERSPGTDPVASQTCGEESRPWKT